MVARVVYLSLNYLVIKRQNPLKNQRDKITKILSLLKKNYTQKPLEIIRWNNFYTDNLVLKFNLNPIVFSVILTMLLVSSCMNKIFSTAVALVAGVSLELYK